MKFDIITIGSALRDIFLTSRDLSILRSKICHPFDENLGRKIPIKKMYFATGGGAINTAVTFAHLGFKVAIFARIGDDAAGQEIIKILKKKRIETSFIEIVKNRPTGYSVIFLSKTGERTALVFRGVSDFKGIKIDALKRNRARWFFITSLGDSFSLLKKVVSLARKNKTKIALNLGAEELKLGINKLKPILNQVNILILNLQESQKLSGTKKEDIEKIFSKISKYTRATIVITVGPKGAWVYPSQERLIYYSPSLPVKVINATGAGDAFGSAFTVGMILKNDISYALKLGILNSVGVIQKMGAQNGLLEKLPSKKELNKLRVISKSLK